jgi:N6-adenosine-specific RNA methylase IME4
VSDKFSLGYCDAPWRFEVRSRDTGLGRSPDQHYNTLTTADLCEMPIGEMFAPNALLAMWIYDPMLPDVFKVAEAWGFPKFVTVLFRWIKSTDGQYRLFDDGERLNFGLGYHTRGGGCEECWLFQRGKGLPVFRHDIRKEFFAPVREHSRKPDEVAKWLEELYGDVPRIELFARTRRPEWHSHGNETSKFTEVSNG